MIYYKKIQEETEEIDSKKCDKCGRIFLAENQEDTFEMQEFLHHRSIGGYGSVFGDEAMIELDLCQNCVKEILGSYLRVGPDWIEKEKYA